jgi:hypothetical protein
MIDPSDDEQFSRAAVEIEVQRRQRAEAESDLAVLLLKTLRGSVWHTTNSERYKGICLEKAILPEPPIPDRDRWGTGVGTIGCPYVRSIGGVSLFDFRDFDSGVYSEQYPISSWREFVPYRSAWGEAIWIEIDVSQLIPGFISGREILDRWKAEHATNRFMPLIEAAHIGALPIKAFRQVLHVSKESVTVLQLADAIAPNGK